MNILVHSKTLPVTQSIRDFVTQQVRKIKKFSQPIQEISVYLDSVKSSHGLSQEAEVKVRIGLPGKAIFARARAHDLYQAISEGVADAARAVRKRKEYRISKKTDERFHLSDKHFIATT